MLLPEVAANTCLETLCLDRSIFQDVDKLSVLAKFDFFVRTTFRNRKIDRGVVAVQGFQEIKSLRDAYVHPKRKPVDWQASEISSDGSEEHIEAPKRTSLLQISQLTGSWGSDEARCVMVAVHRFLKYVFKDVCKLPATAATALLFSEEQTPDRTQPYVPYFDKDVKGLLKQWGVDTSYLRLSWFT